MRLLDTREQKSPRFLIEAFPDIQVMEMESGDYFSGGFTDWATDGVVEKRTFHGNLVEIKIGKDFGIHTEPLERFQDELCRMSEYRRKNPHVCLHAVWLIERETGITERKQFHHYCYKYHVWGHIIIKKSRFIDFLKDLDQPSSYKEFEPFIKRSHDEPTILAKMLRQFPGISSQKAIELSLALTMVCQTQGAWEDDFGLFSMGYQYFELHWEDHYTDAIGTTIGLKKNGDPKKLALQLIHWLETGEML